MIGPLRNSRRTPLPGRRSTRRARALTAVAALVAVATGCQSSPMDREAREPVTLIVSETWLQSQQGSGAGGASGAGQAQARIGQLQTAIDRLRDETRTGWVGRQDDVTGYLGELSGGAWPGRRKPSSTAGGPTRSAGTPPRCASARSTPRRCPP